MNFTPDSKRLVKFNKEHLNKRFSIDAKDFTFIFNNIKVNYDNILITPPEKSVLSKSSKISKNNNKSNKSKTNNKRKNIRLYLNNIDTCRGSSTKKNLKNGNNLIKIFTLLAKENRNVLDKIYLEHKYSLGKQDIINKFIDNDLNKLNKLNFDKCIEWVNLHGIELLRSIYLFHLDRRFPKKINDLLGPFPHTKGEFTSLDIQNEIQLGLKHNTKINMEINGTNLNLLIFSDKKFQPSNKFIKRCFILDNIVNKNRKQINLEIWLSNKKKNLPPKRETKYLGAKEVNSGCNTFNGMENKVSLWRKEELPKVLIHELVHSLNLEKYGSYGVVEEYIYTHFDIGRNNKFNLFENYVEIMAEIVNICLTMIENSKYDLKTFNGLLELECRHCLFQVGKILNYFGYKNWNEFYKKDGILEEDKTGRYLQKSNIFSYFIFRSFILYNIKDFITLCRQRNTINFFKQEFECNELMAIMVKTLNDLEYSQIINLNIEMNKKGNKKELVYNNLRMTCIEPVM